MAKTEAHKEKHKRWLRKHPEYKLKRLKGWVGKEKDPTKKELAEYLLKKHLEKYKDLTI